ncbi:EAL domain-containing protein [Iodidimonas muriae]|uniref:EAL domain-containing protein n=1 Tax=Iodidimonas muriae TaxID=261467 RepID=UPI00166EB89C|nr:EAL domain-containing protein [Iodidimonas muriae]
MRPSTLFLFCVGAFFALTLFPIFGKAEEPSAPVVIGFDRNYAPFEWQDETGQPRGFFVDLGRAVVENGGREAQYVTDTWPGLVGRLEQGDIDILPMLVSKSRAERFQFSRPFYYLTHSLFAAPGLQGLTDIRDIAGHVVAVEKRSYAHDLLLESDFSVTIFETEGTLEALEAVPDGHADVAMVTSAVGMFLLAKYELDLKSYGTPFWPVDYAFAMRKDRHDLAQWFNLAFSETLSEGHYNKIYLNWGSYLDPSTAWSNGSRISDQMAFTAFLIGAALAFVIGAFFWRHQHNSFRQAADFVVPQRGGEIDGADKITDTGEATVKPRLRELDGAKFTSNFPLRPEFLIEAERALANRDHSEDCWELALLKLVDYEDVSRLHGGKVAEHLVYKLANRLLAGSFKAYGYYGRGIFSVLSDRPILRLGRQALLDPVDLDEHDVGSSIQCGLNIVPAASFNLDEIVQQAETALAQSLVRRRTWLMYHADMAPDPMDAKIVRAFRRDEIEGLRAVYQPQIDLKSGCIIGLEALARWDHPEFGSVPPAKFIPLLEQAGLSYRVADKMLSEICAMIASMPPRWAHLTISINFSVQDLSDPDTPSKFSRYFARYGIKPEKIVAELTETAFATDPEILKTALTLLQKKGMRISIDDFGTGFSSLSYLSSFPADEVKIDRHFVSRMLDSQKDRAIIHSTVKLAHDLGLLVVAEGAEDEATLAALIEEGCDRVQGYVIAKPMSRQGLDVFLETYQPAAVHHPS